MEAVECRYRGRVIGWLVEGSDGFLRYISGANSKLGELISLWDSAQNSYEFGVEAFHD